MISQTALEGFTVRSSGCMVTSRFNDDMMTDRQFHRRFSASPSASKKNQRSHAAAETRCFPKLPSGHSHHPYEKQHQWRNCSFSSLPSNFTSDFGSFSRRFDNDDLDRSALQSSEQSFIEIHEDDGQDSSLDVTRSKYSASSKEGMVSVVTGSF